MKIEYCAYTHKGNYRKENQDRLCVGGRGCALQDNQMPELMNASSFAVFAVFDGMGGEQCGDVAAQMAVNRLSEQISSGVVDLKRVCLTINDDICNYMQANEILSMGTTAAIMLFRQEQAVVCNIGDSRVYKIVNGEIEQLSVDHIMNTERFKNRRVLTQHLGIPSSEILIEPYVEITECLPGERYLLCSDGLTDMVSDDRIRDIVLSSSVKSAGERLMQMALENGGKDNISFILCKICD